MPRHIANKQSGSINGHVFTKVKSADCIIHEEISINRKELEDIAWSLIEADVEELDKSQFKYSKKGEDIYAKDYTYYGNEITIIFTIIIKAEILEIIRCDLKLNLAGLKRLPKG